MSEDWKYLFSIGISIFIGFLNYLILLNVVVAVLISIIVFLISIVIILFKPSFPRFIEKIYPQRGPLEKKEEIKLISKATNDVKILGISHRTLWVEPDFEKTLIATEHKDIKITILILDPEGVNLTKRAEEEGRRDSNIWKNDINGSIGTCKELKNKYQTINLELYTYDIYPIWHMVIIDDKKGLISYYPPGHAGSMSPVYVINDHDLSLLTPFIKCFNTIKDGGKKIISNEDIREESV